MSGASNLLVIEPRSILWENHRPYEWTIEGVPDDQRTCRINQQDWEQLRNSFDQTTLARFGERKSCPACADQADIWAAIEFSDGTKKVAPYDFSKPPPAIAVLLKKMDTIAAKCPSQMVMSGGRPTSLERNARKPTKIVDPVYPEGAKSAGIQGNVVVYVIIGRAGEVEAVTAASGPEKLRQSAMDAVQQWKWEPLEFNGKPVRFRTRAVVRFSLGKKNSPDENWRLFKIS